MIIILMVLSFVGGFAVCWAGFKNGLLKIKDKTILEGK